MEELNKKLLDLAGFKKANLHPLYWYPAGGASLSEEELPDFPNSLDCCFKWLVPKLAERYNLDGVLLFIRWTIQRESLLERSRIPGGWDAEIWFRDRQNIEGIWAATPALALCKAIEKLIDGAGKDV